MKKIFTLLVGLIFTIGSFAQVAKVEGDKSTLDKALAENQVAFVMPENTTEAEVLRSAQYYTEYFTVDYDADNGVATITLVNEDPMAKRVITRFLLSTGVRTVNFDGEDYTIMEFYTSFLE